MLFHYFKSAKRKQIYFCILKECTLQTLHIHVFPGEGIREVMPLNMLFFSKKIFLLTLVSKYSIHLLKEMYRIFSICPQ